MIELRNITPDRFERWLSAESRAHGNRLNHDPDHLRPRFDLSRSIAVFESGKIVGGCHSHRLEMSIPGGTSVVAGVSNVEVQPTHTRRGIMTQMMRHQIDGIHERGEPLAALFATESGIYGRFGYGIGAVHEQWTIEKRHSAYDRRLESSGRLEFVAPADIMKMLPEVSRRGTQGRSAVFQRAMHHWEDAANDPIHAQGGPGGVFYVAYVQDGRIDGYACYRTQRPTVTVNELVSTTRAASAALWRFCFDLDLYERTEAARRPTDDPLPWMLADPRRLQRSTRDGLWVRVVDARAALEQRTYASSDRLALEIRDDFCDWNRGCWSLEMSPKGGECRPATGGADLAISVSALASVYLGAASFGTLQQAGLVDEATSGAVQRADRAFAVALKPWTPYNF
jgi:predicted acetyltransferase